MREMLVLALSGAAGTLARWGLSGAMYRLLGERFPYGTLAVNVVGCVLLGAGMETALLTDALPRALRVPLAAGFLGAFTTFSTFGYETMRYVEDGAWSLAGINIVANLVLGLGATWLGFVTARVGFGGS